MEKSTERAVFHCRQKKIRFFPRKHKIGRLQAPGFLSKAPSEGHSKRTSAPESRFFETQKDRLLFRFLGLRLMLSRMGCARAAGLVFE